MDIEPATWLARKTSNHFEKYSRKIFHTHTHTYTERQTPCIRRKIYFPSRQIRVSDILAPNLLAVPRNEKDAVYVWMVLDSASAAVLPRSYDDSFVALFDNVVYVRKYDDVYMVGDGGEGRGGMLSNGGPNLPTAS